MEQRLSGIQESQVVPAGEQRLYTLTVWNVTFRNPVGCMFRARCAAYSIYVCEERPQQFPLYRGGRGAGGMTLTGGVAAAVPVVSWWNLCL